MTTYY
jgi:hypothetical protein